MTLATESTGHRREAWAEPVESTGKSTTLSLLNREWESRHAHAVHVFGDLGQMSGGELLDLIASARKPQQDGLLHQLITIAHCHSPAGETAGRALVQCMIPKALKLAASCTALRGLCGDERMGILISCLWQAIQCYPIHIRRSVAGTLSLGTLHELNASESVRRTRDRHIDEIPTDMAILPGLAGATTDVEYEVGRTNTGDESFDDLVRVLSWAVDSCILNREEVAILAKADLGDPEDRASLALEHACTPATMQKRVWRIRTKLIDAMSQYISENGEW